MDKMEYQKLGDKFYNFGAGEYVPLTSNITDKLKSNNILINSIIDTKYENILFNLTNKLKDKIGTDRTCWGIKNVDGDLEYELYFYSRPIESDKIKSIIDEFFDLPDIDMSESTCFMWSFDINNKKKDINLYFHDHGFYDRDLFFFGGSSYKYDGVDYYYDNTYYFW